MVVVVAFLFWILIQYTCFPSTGSLTWEWYFSMGINLIRCLFLVTYWDFEGQVKTVLIKSLCLNHGLANFFLKGLTDILGFVGLLWSMLQQLNFFFFFSFKDFFRSSFRFTSKWRGEKTKQNKTKMEGWVKRFLIYPQPSICITFSPLLIFHTRVAHWL